MAGEACELKVSKRRWTDDEDQWGNLTSLYGDLNPKQVELVETAIRFCSFGDFEKALQIFEQKLPSTPFIPIIALEHANCYASFGAFSLEAERLAQALSDVQENQLEILPEVQWLIRIRLAMARYESEGTLKFALDEARSLRDWLIDTDIQDYSDVMVQCIANYQRIVQDAGTYSNWVEKSNDGDLPPTVQKSATASLTKLRKYLQGEKRLRECFSLMRTEATLYTKDSQVDPYEELLSVNWNASKHESIASKLCLLRLFHAKKLHDHGHTERATGELKKAKQQICRNTGKPLEVFNTRYGLLSSITESLIHPLLGVGARLQRHIDLAKQAMKIGDRTIQRGQLVYMEEQARELMERGDSGSSTLIAHKVFREVILESLSFAAGTHPHPSTAAHSLLALAGYQYLQSDLDMLHHLDRFFEKWPNFDLPLLLVGVLDKKYKLVRMLDGDAVAASMIPECNEALANTPNIRRAQNGILEALDDPGELRLHTYSYQDADDLSDNMLYVIKRLVRWIRHEISNAMPESQAREVLCVEDHSKNWLDNTDPVYMVTQIFGRDEPTESIKWKSWLDKLMRLLKDPVESFSEVHRHELLVQICRHRKSSLTSHILKIQGESLEGSSEISLELQRQSRDETEEFVRIYQSLRAEAVPSLTLWHMKGDLIRTDYNLILSQDKLQPNTLNDEMMAGIQGRFEEYVTFLGSTPLKQMLFIALQTLAKMYSIRWLKFNTVPITKVWEALQGADEIFQRFVGQDYVLQSVQAFALQMYVAEEYNASDLYRLGVGYTYIALCLWYTKNRQWMEGNSDQPVLDDLKQISMSFVQWTQKSKGRAIALAIGVESEVPRAFLENAWASSSSKELMTKYDELKKELGPGTSIIRSIAIYEELESLWNKMESSSTGVAFLGMLRGRTTNSEELVWLASIFDEDVVFVDWMQIPNLSQSSDLAMAIYQKGRLVEVWKIDIELHKVESWISEYLEPNAALEDNEEAHLPLNGRFSTKHLREMDVLLKGLEHFTKPGQILVFCPTKAMNKIPLHGLMLDNKLCICRNPVVYCQSLSLLRLCFLDRLALEERTDLSDRQAIVIDGLAVGSHTTPALSDISTILSTTVEHLNPLSHENVDHGTNNDNPPDRRQTFANLTKNASLLHFHGHVIFDRSEPMKHHLQLAPRRSDSRGKSLPLLPSEQLAVRDIFTLPFQRGAHVTTISCKSASSHVTKVDDHIGIMTAFHSVGAASMISSLWDLFEPTGIRFSKLFYENLKREQERFFVEPDPEKGNGEWKKVKGFPYLDMARAMQKTIVKIRKDEKTGEVMAPYNWAGLVLSGNWAIPKVWIEKKAEEGGSKE